MPNTQYLTKTDFKWYLDSPKHLWVKINTPDQFHPKVSLLDQYTAKQGYQVEKIARGLFNEGVMMPVELEAAVEKTKQALSNKKPIYQATVQSGRCLAKADILVFDQTAQKWNLYEVKSKNKISKNGKFDQDIIQDVAFQKIVFAKAGVDLGEVFVIHLNEAFVKKGDIQAADLLKIDNVSAAVSELMPEIELNIADALKIMDYPDASDLSSCYKPKTCPCLTACHPNLPEYSIYDLARITKSKVDALRQQNISVIAEIPDLMFKNKQQQQIELTKNQTAQIDQLKIQTVLSNLKYPLYFLDYETFNPAIPLLDGYKPYQHMVFQYSLHVLAEPNAKLKHFEFVAKNYQEVGKELVIDLQKNIGATGSIIVWHKGFEMGRNKELALNYPEFGAFLNDVNARIFDLEDLFKGIKETPPPYADYRFKGSSSIKNVLPVLVPELSYKVLKIQKGDEAMISWLKAVNNELAGSEKAQVFADLLKYCELDTKAMVEIYNQLLRSI